MDNKISDWNSSALPKPERNSHTARVVIAVLGVVFLTILSIGIFRPMGALPKPEQGEGLPMFSTEMIVQRNGVVQVLENVRTVMEGEKPRHGITRNYPKKLVGEDGKTRTLSFSGLSATYAKFTSPSSFPESIPVAPHGDSENVAKFRVGNSGKTLAKGTYDFSVQFDVQGLVEPMKKGQATGLRWDLTGGLVFPISGAQLKIKLPEFVDPKTVEVGTFLGTVDGRDSYEKALNPQSAGAETSVDFMRSKDERDVFVTIRPRRPLKSFERMVVKVSWPRGFLDNGL